jgi:hypothetical protein
VIIVVVVVGIVGVRWEISNGSSGSDKVGNGLIISGSGAKTAIGLTAV